jgi:hypothetical protein
MAGDHHLDYLTATARKTYIIAQANSPVDDKGSLRPTAWFAAEG